MSDEHDVQPGQQDMNRRRALKVLGALPIAAAVADAQQAPPDGKTRQGHERTPQPANDTRQPRAQPARRFFTAKEMRTVRVLSDDVIPRDARSGSATDAGVPEFIDFHLSVEETSADTRTAWRGGLRWLDTESRKRFGVAYAGATAAQRHAILDDIAGPLGPPLAAGQNAGQNAGQGTAQNTTQMTTPSPAAGAVAQPEIAPELRYGAAFLARARDMIASGFFSSAMGYRDLQYMGNTFVPVWNGCPPEALRKLGVSY